jgi:hypothetical protein
MSDAPTAPRPAGDAVGHGNSVAAWTAVGIVVLGALVSSVAVAIAQPWLFWVGLGVIVVGAVTGKVLTAMGFGEQPHD